MQWYPVGPDFVFDPLDTGFTRLSPSNEGGVNGRVLSIAFDASADPLAPSVMYVVAGEGDQPARTTSVFRRAAGDPRWSCPGDALLAAHATADPRCVATHPSFPNHAYVGTWGDRAVYLFDGATWSAPSAVPGRIRKLVVDPRPVPTIAQTILYAATDDGVYRSGNNGGSWTQVLPGDCWSLAAHIPAAGSPRFYAGLATSGVWFADTEPLAAAAWANVLAPRGFERTLVDCCAANPDCAYAWFGRGGGGDSVYGTLTPTGTWTPKNGHVTAPDLVTSAPFDLQQWQTYENFMFAVAPDSPADGSNDVLIFGSLLYSRSHDSGVTWRSFRDYYHVDVHALAFAPGAPAAFYVGCDGGIAVYSDATRTTFDPNLAPTPDDRSTRDAVSPLTKTFRSLSRGLTNSCAYGVGQDANGLTQLYVGCVDSGIAFKDGGLGWRSWQGGDAFSASVARASDGVRVRQELFSGLGNYSGLLSLATHADVPGGVTGHAFPTGDSGGYVYSTSNLVIGDSGDCYAGGYVDAIVGNLTTTVPAAMHAVTVPVSSTAGLTDGDFVALDDHTPHTHTSQHYPVTNVTPTSFDIGVLYWDAPAGTTVRRLELCAFGNAADRSTRVLSQAFTPNTMHHTVTAFARGGGKLACATFDTTTSSTALWTVAEAATAGGPAVWASVPLPAGVPAIGGLALDVSGDAYVLFQTPHSSGGVTSPLYRLPSGAAAVTPEQCTAVPALQLPDGTAAPFTHLLGDPFRAGVLWAAASDGVFRLDLHTGAARTWAWSPAGTGLPGTWITDLAFTNFAPRGAAAKPILRVATDGRGVWELDTTDGAEPAAADLYLRRHLLDAGWLDDLRDGLPNPVRPGEQVWHWECVDIKVDRPTQVTAGAYFQTDPDASGVPFTDLTVPAGPIVPAAIPFTNVQFDMLADFGDSVPSGGRVRVHVQLQNRSTTAADGVSVWALWTHPSGLLPGLNANADGTTFDFWAQFHGDGSIHPALPMNSRWKSVGDPITLGGVRVDQPQIASWNWDAPWPSGHYCLAVFVHSLHSPIGETTDFSMDDVVVHNKQVGQKNLQVVDGAHPMRLMDVVVDLNNPDREATRTTAVLDVPVSAAGAAVGLQLPANVKAVVSNALPWWSPRRLLDILLFWRYRKSGFGPTVYRPYAGKPLMAADIPLPPHGSVPVRVLVEGAPKSGRANVSLRQLAGKRVGGSTIQIRSRTGPARAPGGTSKVADHDEHEHALTKLDES